MSRKTIIRIDKTRGYSVIANECFRDPNLSARAKGIFGYIMTLPDDWKLYKRELYSHFKEGREAIDTAFRELEQAGYVFKKAVRDEETGRFGGWEYTIYEKPQQNTELLETRISGSQHFGKPATTKDVEKKNTNRREYVERKSPSQRSTAGKASNSAGRPKTPQDAPWRGVDYSEVPVPSVSGYDDLYGLGDPILGAMAVTGDHDGYGYWISFLNGACNDMETDMACRVFFGCLEQIYGQRKAGELRNPAAALNVMLKDLFT